MADDYSSKIEKASQFGDGPEGKFRLWLTEIQAAEKEKEKFDKDADKIVRRYLDKRDAYQEAESRVNIFWSTIDVVKSSIYARPPKADVHRLYKDFDDDVPRVAGEMLERLLNNEIEMDGSSFDASARHGIEDWLIVGMGQMWNRYEAKTEPEIVPAEIDPMTGETLVEEQQYERLVSEDAITEWVSYKDFFWSPARVWEEVRWVARRVYMTRDQLTARFGEEIAKKVPLQSSKPKKAATVAIATQNEPWQKAEVFEIWCKTKKTVYWLAKGMDQLLDEREDPLGLADFFPCPPAIMANLTTSNLMPRADYIMAQDQFEELDEINTRIKWLTKAAKVVGAYNKSAGDSVGRILQQAVENQLVPVDNWAMFAEAGGIKGQIDWVPIDQVVNAIDKLRVYRQDKIQQIYEVLGISDIMRGSTKASETAAAQQIKAQFGSTRLQLKQFYVAQWIQAGLRIKAEIIMKHFQPETIIMRSNVMMTPDKDKAQPAAELLKNTAINRYRIVVEADSMAALDWAEEREMRMNFLNGLGAFINASMPLAQAEPGAAPFLLRLIQWGMGAFRASKSVEGILDQAIQQMEQKSQQPPQPNPMQDVEIEEKKAGAMERRAQAVKEISDAIEKMAMINQPLPVPVNAIVDGGLMGSNGETLQSLVQKLDQVVAEATAPKQVIRDPQTGKVVGVQPVAAGPTAPTKPTIDGIAKQIEALAMLANAPKKVVRDQSGKVVGVQPVPQQPQPLTNGTANLPQPQQPMN